MASITIYMLDGTVREFKHEGRAGGSYTKILTYEDGVAIIEDEYYNKTAIPLHLIKEIKENPVRW